MNWWMAGAWGSNWVWKQKMGIETLRMYCSVCVCVCVRTHILWHMWVHYNLAVYWWLTLHWVLCVASGSLSPCNTHTQRTHTDTHTHTHICPYNLSPYLQWNVTDYSHRQQAPDLHPGHFYILNTPVDGDLVALLPHVARTIGVREVDVAAGLFRHWL